MSKTHWRTVAGKEYLVGEELNGKEVTLTIEKVELTEIRNQKGVETKPVAFFVGTTKRLVLNVTNMKAIARALGSGYIEDWQNKKITLIPQSGRFFGVNQEVIRVKTDIKDLV